MSATTPHRPIPPHVRGLSLGQRIKWARTTAGLSHDRLVEKLGRSNRGHLIKIEQGSHMPRVDLRNAIADACGIPRDLLADEDDEEADSLSLDDILRLRIRQIVREETRS